MGKLKLIALAMYLLVSFTLGGQTITVDSNVSGKVDYAVTKPSKDVLVFTLLGDGDFSLDDDPMHEFNDTSGTYVTESFFVETYDLDPPPTSMVNTGSTSGGNKANNAKRAMSIEVDILTSWKPAHGTEDFFIVAFKNIKEPNPVDGCIEFHYNTNDLTVGYSGIRDYGAVSGLSIEGSATPYNEALKWKFTNLKHNEMRYIYIPAKVLLLPRQLLKLKANYMVDCQPSDSSGGGASKNYSQGVSKWPHDPNSKIAYPECLDPIALFQHIEYKISFYNEGDGPAHNVRVIDTLPQSLEPYSISIVDYEFLPTVSINGQEVIFDFIGIDLPGEKQVDGGFMYSYDDISSYVTFTICTRPPILMCIENKASIYFDSQDPIVTPTSKICVAEQCSYYTCGSPIPGYSIGHENWQIEESKEGQSIHISPNPFEDFVQLELEISGLSEEQLLIEIYDTSGRLMKKMKEETGFAGKLKKEIYLNDLPDGMYFLVVHMPGQKITKKIIKY